MSNILVEGEYTVEQFRGILDSQSGMCGLPTMTVHDPSEELVGRFGEAHTSDSSAVLEYRVRNGVDGTVELEPGISFRMVVSNEQ